MRVNVNTFYSFKLIRFPQADTFPILENSNIQIFILVTFRFFLFLYSLSFYVKKKSL